MTTNRPRITVDDLHSAATWLGAYEVSIDENHSSEIADLGADHAAVRDDELAVSLLRVREWLLAEIASRTEDSDVRQLIAVMAKQGRVVSAASARAALRRTKAKHAGNVQGSQAALSAAAS